MRITIVTDSPVTENGHFDRLRINPYVIAGETEIEVIFVEEFIQPYQRGQKRDLILLPLSIKHDEELYNEVYTMAMSWSAGNPSRIIPYYANTY